MGRLIDADAFLQNLINCDIGRKSLEKVIEAVKKQPTAYDTDEVVEQLKKKAIPVLDEDEHIIPESNNQECYEIEMVALSDAIKIVRGGGVEQESECEWKLEDAEQNLYVTECENRQLIFEGTPEENGYKYCSYCGRKIKRGETD